MLRKRELAKLKDNAVEAADFLSSLANDKRLLILCELMARREMSVGGLAHVLVQTRRESQTIFYRLSSGDRMKRMLSLLIQLFCQ